MWILFVALLLVLSLSERLYSDTKSKVIMLTGLNFNKWVTSVRSKGISIVHFYQKYDDLSKSKILREFGSLSEELNGIAFFGAVSCDDESAICEKEGITKYPTVRIYPRSPIPTMDFVENEYSIEEIKKSALRTIEGNTIEITQTNIETFLKDNPTKPKVLYFTDKPKGVPVTIKALSQSFEKTIFFGVVRKEED